MKNRKRLVRCEKQFPERRHSVPRTIPVTTKKKADDDEEEMAAVAQPTPFVKQLAANGM